MPRAKRLAAGKLDELGIVAPLVRKRLQEGFVTVYCRAAMDIFLAGNLHGHVVQKRKELAALKRSKNLSVQRIRRLQEEIREQGARLEEMNAQILEELTVPPRAFAVLGSAKEGVWSTFTVILRKDLLEK